MKHKGLKILAGRVISSLALLFFVITLVFFIIKIAPGSPANKYISPNLSPKLLQSISERYSFEGNVFEQYLNYLGNIITGDFGYSITHKLPVLSVIAEYLPLTALIALLAFTLQSLFSIFLAYISYIKPVLKPGLQNISFVFYTIPSYITGLILIIIFAVFAGIFPVSGIRPGTDAGISDYFFYLTLPVITLSLPGIALFYSYLISTVEKNKNAEFVLFAQSLGMNNKQIFFQHILPNSVVPLLSIAAIETGYLLSGSLIIEVLFSLPGFGKLTFTAFMDRDYPLIIGTTMLSSFFMIFANLAADLIKYHFDKRMRELI